MHPEDNSQSNAESGNRIGASDERTGSEDLFTFSQPGSSSGHLETNVPSGASTSSSSINASAGVSLNNSSSLFSSNSDDTEGINSPVEVIEPTPEEYKQNAKHCQVRLLRRKVCEKEDENSLNNTALNPSKPFSNEGDINSSTNVIESTPEEYNRFVRSSLPHHSHHEECEKSIEASAINSGRLISNFGNINREGAGNPLELLKSPSLICQAHESDKIPHLEKGKENKNNNSKTSLFIDVNPEKQIDVDPETQTDSNNEDSCPPISQERDNKLLCENIDDKMQRSGSDEINSVLNAGLEKNTDKRRIEKHQPKDVFAPLRHPSDLNFESLLENAPRTSGVSSKPSETERYFDDAPELQEPLMKPSQQLKPYGNQSPKGKGKGKGKRSRQSLEKLTEKQTPEVSDEIPNNHSPDIIPATPRIEKISSDVISETILRKENTSHSPTTIPRKESSDMDADSDKLKDISKEVYEESFSSTLEKVSLTETEQISKTPDLFGSLTSPKNTITSKSSSYTDSDKSDKTKIKNEPAPKSDKWTCKSDNLKELKKAIFKKTPITRKVIKTTTIKRIVEEHFICGNVVVRSLLDEPEEDQKIEILEETTLENHEIFKEEDSENNEIVNKTNDVGQSNITSNSTNFEDFNTGERVLAKWHDGYYYSGITIEKTVNGKWIVLYDDGTKKEALSGIIPFDIFPVGMSVYARFEEKEYESGMIRDVKCNDKKNAEYFVELDNGKKQWVAASKLSMTFDQVSAIFNKKLSSQTYEPGINLANVVHEKRVSKQVSSPKTPIYEKRGKKKRKIDSPETFVAQKRLKKANDSDTETSTATCDFLKHLREKFTMLQTSGVQLTEEVEGITTSKTSVLSSTDYEAMKNMYPHIRTQDILQSSPYRIMKDLFPSDLNTPQFQSTKGVQEDATVVEESEMQSTKEDGKELVLIFAGMKFLITDGTCSINSSPEDSSSAQLPQVEFNRLQIESLIKNNGGRIVDKINELEVSSSKYYLVSKWATRTGKFLQSIAAGIPCVSHEWVLNCCRQNTLLNHNAYMLPIGSIDDEPQEWHGKKNIFSGCRFGLVFRNDAESLQLWSLILSLGGADVEPKELIVEDESDLSSLDAVITMAKTNINFPQEEIQMILKKKITVLTIDWVINSLIHGEKQSFFSGEKSVITALDSETFLLKVL